MWVDLKGTIAKLRKGTAKCREERERMQSCGGGAKGGNERPRRIACVRKEAKGGRGALVEL